MLRQILRYLARQVFAPGVDLADRLDDLFEWRALQKIAANSSRERALNINIPFKSREHYNSGGGKGSPNRGNGADPAHIGESQIHQRDIRLVFRKFLDGCLGSSRRRDK